MSEQYNPNTETVPGQIDGTDLDDSIVGTPGNDVIQGGDGDDNIQGGDGLDTLEGGYGDDLLDGGDGNDFLQGGRGSDLLLGGLGDDLLVSRSDAGEQRVGQLAIGQPTREDPDGELDAAREKLYVNQPLVGDDILVGGAGKDTFLFTPQINGKLEILERNVKSNGYIDWTMHGVAGVVSRIISPGISRFML